MKTSTVVVAAAIALAVAPSSFAEPRARRTQLPTGQYITPEALPLAEQQLLNPGLPSHPDFVANEAVRAQVSPDGSTLLVLCAGYNGNLDASANVDLAASNQYIFVYDLSGAHKRRPALRQVVQQANAYVGLVWAPDGKSFYATGGSDDAVYRYAKSGGQWTLSARIDLGHHGAGLGLFGQEPNAAGLALSPDGKRLVVANNYNDSISLIDTASGAVQYEHDLRPFAPGNEGTSGGVGGTFPVAVALTSAGVAYVTANRDREVVVVDLSSKDGGRLVTRIPLDGLPNGLAMDKAQSRLFVAQDNADQVAVIELATNTVVQKIDTRAPPGLLRDPASGRYTGAAPIAVTLSPDERTLYVVNDGANSIAVVPLTGRDAYKVKGLIPTAYAPKDVALSKDGSWLYIVNGKSDQGPNPLNLFGDTGRLTTVTYPGGNQAAQLAAAASNQYQLNNNRSTLVSARVPAHEELEGLTRLVAQNNFYVAQEEREGESEGEGARDVHDRRLAAVRSQIKHVIYIIKENRTFDQVLGDLGNGAKGDPSLAVFGEAITPNQHRLARNFVTLDNFLDTGDASMDGWSWSLQGRATSITSLTQNINYAPVDRGLSYLTEGTNRDLPVGLPVAVRIGVFGSFYTGLLAGQPGGAANALTGTGDVAATDAPFGAGKGYIFDAVLAAGGTVRNYGMLTYNVGPISIGGVPITNAGAEGVQQVVPFNLALFPAAPNAAGSTDVYFRGFDNDYPDVYRFNEWKREFDGYVQGGNLPTLELVRFHHDHTGSFGSAIAGVDTPETQVADNDLAVGKLVEAVAHSPYAKETLIFVLEDDSQDGPDHLDSHRTTAYVVGPCVKQRAVISRHYTSVNWLRTIEDVLGLPHLNLNTAYQPPMSEIFAADCEGAWDFTAEASSILKNTAVAAAPIGGEPVRFGKGPALHPTHGAAWWASKTRSFDFSAADRASPARYNRVLWEGLKPGKPYPEQLASRTVVSPAASERDDD
jgi:DNA-binding beta-propeller fold protein YncE